MQDAQWEKKQEGVIADFSAKERCWKGSVPSGQTAGQSGSSHA